MKDGDRQRRLEDIFHEALERDASDRPAFLDRACAGEPELRREVEDLLSFHAGTGGLFDAPRDLAGDLIRGSAEPPVEGRSVGPYRILREIGMGGMGRVFLAEREDLPKRVALKLVREPLASPDRVRRFRREQRVLAGLEHPHIAQLIDAGVTGDGSPWLAMEYVDGRMITHHCDRAECGTEERLRLFLGVCDAVRYAHANLVVHRDIKPSNVMVTRDGRPKLLDFGVAKLLDPTADAEPTRTGLRPFTPAYAAPEQLTGGRVSTATDVYQLGALLYELGTGRPPFDLAERTPAEAERILREEDPVRPRQLRNALAADLETVIMKALEKEPERRYPSVEALANDVERFLQRRPVVARPATAGYRARKFLVRHKAAAGVALLLLGYAVTVTWSAAGIARERSRAEREAATATRVSDFLVDVFTRADPTDTVPGQATALELVDRGAERVDNELAGEPEVQAAMQEVLGQVYHELGRAADAEALLRSALANRLELFGDGSLEVASAQHYLAQVLWSKGDLEGADTLNQRALETRRRLLDESDEGLWQTLGNLGTVRQFQGLLQEAEDMVAEVVEMIRSAYPDGHPALGAYLNNLANIHHARGDYQRAQSMMQQAIESDRRYLPAEHPDLALRLDNLAYMALRGEAFEDALLKAEEALAMYWRVYEGPHPHMPYAMTTIADASLALGDTVRADSTHEAALTMRRSLLGDGHPDLYQSYRDMGRHLLETGRSDEADRYFQEALSIAREARGEEHEWFGTALWHLGLVRERQGDPQEAEAMMRRAYTIHVAALGEEHPTVAAEREHLIELLRDSGRSEEAEALVASWSGS